MKPRNMVFLISTNVQPSLHDELLGIASYRQDRELENDHSLAGEPQIPEFDQLSLNPSVAGVLVADDRKGHCLGA